MRETTVYILETKEKTAPYVSWFQYFLSKQLADEIKEDNNKSQNFISELSENKYFVSGDKKVFKMTEIGELFDEEAYSRKQKLENSIKAKLSEEELKYLNL